MKKSYVSWLPAELRNRTMAAISELIRISNFPANILPFAEQSQQLPLASHWLEQCQNFHPFFDMAQFLTHPTQISLYNWPLILPSAPLWLQNFSFKFHFLHFNHFFAFRHHSFKFDASLYRELRIRENPLNKKKPRWIYFIEEINFRLALKLTICDKQGSLFFSFFDWLCNIWNLKNLLNTFLLRN